METKKLIIIRLKYDKVFNYFEGEIKEYPKINLKSNKEHLKDVCKDMLESFKHQIEKVYPNEFNTFEFRVYVTVLDINSKQWILLSEEFLNKHTYTSI